MEQQRRLERRIRDREAADFAFHDASQRRLDRQVATMKEREGKRLQDERAAQASKADRERALIVENEGEERKQYLEMQQQHERNVIAHARRSAEHVFRCIEQQQALISVEASARMSWVASYAGAVLSLGLQGTEGVRRVGTAVDERVSRDGSSREFIRILQILHVHWKDRIELGARESAARAQFSFRAKQHVARAEFDHSELKIRSFHAAREQETRSVTMTAFFDGVRAIVFEREMYGRRRDTIHECDALFARLSLEAQWHRGVITMAVGPESLARLAIHEYRASQLNHLYQAVVAERDDAIQTTRAAMDRYRSMEVEAEQVKWRAKQDADRFQHEVDKVKGEAKARIQGLSGEVEATMQQYRAALAERDTAMSTLHAKAVQHAADLESERQRTVEVGESYASARGQLHAAIGDLTKNGETSAAARLHAVLRQLDNSLTDIREGAGGHREGVRRRADHKGSSSGSKRRANSDDASAVATPSSHKGGPAAQRSSPSMSRRESTAASTSEFGTPMKLGGGIGGGGSTAPPTAEPSGTDNDDDGERAVSSDTEVEVEERGGGASDQRNHSTVFPPPRRGSNDSTPNAASSKKGDDGHRRPLHVSSRSSSGSHKEGVAAEMVATSGVIHEKDRIIDDLRRRVVAMETLVSFRPPVAVPSDNVTGDQHHQVTSDDTSLHGVPADAPLQHGTFGSSVDGGNAGQRSLPFGTSSATSADAYHEALVRANQELLRRNGQLLEENRGLQHPSREGNVGQEQDAAAALTTSDEDDHRVAPRGDRQDRRRTAAPRFDSDDSDHLPEESRRSTVVNPPPAALAHPPAGQLADRGAHAYHDDANVLLPSRPGNPLLDGTSGLGASSGGGKHRHPYDALLSGGALGGQVHGGERGGAAGAALPQRKGVAAAVAPFRSTTTYDGIPLGGNSSREARLGDPTAHYYVQRAVAGAGSVGKHEALIAAAMSRVAAAAQSAASPIATRQLPAVGGASHQR